MTKQREIIGFMIGSTIYCGWSAIQKVRDNENFDAIIYRDIVKIIAACDLGINWKKMLEMPTLLYQDSENNYSWTKKDE